MSGMLSSAEVLVTAAYKMFGLEDEAAPLDYMKSVEVTDWLEVDHAGFRVHVAEDLPQLCVRIEYWNGEPPPAPDGQEIQCAVRLRTVSGALAINEMIAGQMPGVFVLPADTDFAVRVTGYGRERARRAIRERFDQSADDREFGDSVPALDGTERYIFQCWPS
ncbi:hypothetical protein ACSNOI_31845 [Actinomadura kijaniata]|uniref:hypothetical protein n=1 Tax=Actinomadura kijaniata TaxID=46161 RepID=UPI003F1A8E28